MHSHVYCSIIHYSQAVKQAVYINRRMDIEDMICVQCNIMLLKKKKKKQNPAIFGNMDGS